MKRRAFLGLLGTGIAGLTLDPELLLWKPGAKTIFLPALKPSLFTAHTLMRGDVFTIDGLFAINPVTGVQTTHPQHYVVTADVRSGEFDLSAVYPRIIHPTPRMPVRPLYVGRTMPTIVEWADSGQNMPPAQRTVELL